MKYGLKILLLVLGLAVLPSAAHATNPCPPIIRELCSAFTVTATIDTIRAKIDVYFTTLKSAWEGELDERLTEANIITQYNLQKRQALFEALENYQEPLGDASCVVPSLGTVVSTGGAPAPIDSGGSTGGTAGGASRGVTQPPVPSLAFNRRQPPSTAGVQQLTQNASTQQVENQVVADAAQRLQTDAQRPAAEVASERFAETALYVPRPPHNAPLPDADILAETIFSNDLISQALLESLKDVVPLSVSGVPPTLRTAADALCRNLMAPATADPSTGIAHNAPERLEGNNQARSAMARLQLALQICSEAVGRRAVKGIGAPNAGQGVTNDTGTLRKLSAIGQQTEAQAIAAINNLPVAQRSPAQRVKLAHYTDVLNQGNQWQNFVSQHQMMRAFYTQYFSTDQDFIASISGNRTDVDLIRALTQIETQATALQWRIYEMQERMNLVRAAQLAAEVENDITDPVPVTGGQ